MKKKLKKVNAAILIIGNEILSGRTQDKNIAFIKKMTKYFGLFLIVIGTKFLYEYFNL